MFYTGHHTVLFCSWIIVLVRVWSVNQPQKYCAVPRPEKEGMSVPHRKYVHTSRVSGYGSYDESELPSKMVRSSYAEESTAFSDSEQFGGSDEFREDVDVHGSRSKGTGRLRKKTASRGKGGTFSMKKKKRRIYSCCLGNEIDTARLHDCLNSLPAHLAPMQSLWASELYTDTLHITRKFDLNRKVDSGPTSGADESSESQDMSVSRERSAPARAGAPTLQYTASFRPNFESPELKAETVSEVVGDVGGFSGKFHFSLVKEVFVFEFGAAVFWGFSAGEEQEMLQLIRSFVSKELSIKESANLSDDDMAFSLAPAHADIAIISDILYLPENTITKQRLAMSFALGQSTVLALFESQIETKIPEYNYLPMSLATTGRIPKMNSADVGKLIGELFVIRHSLNLHTDILDIPDFFWEEDKFEPEYKNVWKYLEMDSRIAVLNRRLDLIKEMLDLLQFQVERGEITYLDWVIITLIIVFCFVEVVGMYL